MKFKNIVLLIIVVLIILVGILYFQKSSSGKYDSFAQCLTEKGVKMYGAFWCPHCAEQKKLFGESFKLVTYVECSNPDKSENDNCLALGIKTYPTWEFSGGKRLEGGLGLEQIGTFAGCNLPLN